MKFLHTADLHLGKTLHEFSMEDQQQRMLDSIIHILHNDDYCALLISGDIYDRSLPSANAVTLFSKFLARLNKELPALRVFIIPGNHDSSLRLSYASEILKNMSIYIANDITKISTPISISQDGEIVDLYLLPFLQSGVFSIKDNENKDRIMTTQSEMAIEAAKQINQSLSDDKPAILLAHLFTKKGISSSTERQFIGTAELVDPEIFSKFSYVALGHLHRYQKITDRIYYSGSPLAYAFDESEYTKYVLSVNIDCTNIKSIPIVTPIPIEPLRKLTKLSANFHDLLEKQEYKKYTNDYLEITLTGENPIESPMQILQKQFPYIMNIQQESFIQKIDNQIESEILESQKNNANLIDNFQIFSQAIQQESTEEENILFTELYKGIENEA